MGSSRRLFTIAALLAGLVLSPVAADDRDANSKALVEQYRTVAAVEHASRHVYHLQTKALLAFVGGWAAPAEADGSEIDSLSGVPTQVVQVELNRLKARIGRGAFEPEFAAELTEIIALLENAMATSLEISALLTEGRTEEALAVYEKRSMTLYEQVWRRTYTLSSAVARRM